MATTVATTFQPSTTNSVGTAAGLLVGGIAAKWLVAAPFVIKLAAIPIVAALGITPMSLAGIGCVIATGLTSYLVTHVAEVREAATFILAVKDIKAEASYPVSKDGAFGAPPPTESNINKAQS